MIDPDVFIEATEVLSRRIARDHDSGGLLAEHLGDDAGRFALWAEMTAGSPAGAAGVVYGYLLAKEEARIAKARACDA